MLSRRLLRIKILHALYAFFKANNDSVQKSEKELFFSIGKSYDLFHYLLLLIVDVVNYAGSRIELAKEKRMPSYEDLNPNTKFVDNKLFKQIEENADLKKYLSNTKLSWVNYPELIKKIYQNVTQSDFYSKYMSDKNSDYETDKKIIIDIFEQIIPEEELLFQILEEQSIYWNDDIEFIISMVIKSLKKFSEKDGEHVKLPHLYKNDDDVDFVKTLFRNCIKNHESSLELIEKYSKNWDLERIAFMDILLLEMAISEILNIESIPVKVSFNEYIELAKFYSTEKSSVFVNGVLDRIINSLKENNKIKKRGRGLIGEI